MCQVVVPFHKPTGKANVICFCFFSQAKIAEFSSLQNTMHYSVTRHQKFQISVKIERTL